MERLNNAITTDTPHSAPDSSNRYQTEQQHQHEQPSGPKADHHHTKQTEPSQIAQLPQSRDIPEEPPQQQEEISRTIRTIGNSQQFKTPHRDDSIRDITRKLSLIMNEIKIKINTKDVPLAGIWMDIWSIIAKFITLGLPKNEALQTTTKREIFTLLTPTTNMDLKEWISRGWIPQVATKIWRANNQANQTNTTGNDDQPVPRVEDGDSMDTFRVKVKTFSNIIKTKLDTNSSTYNKDLRARLAIFLRTDEPWASHFKTLATIHAGQNVFSDQPNQNITPDDIERWLTAMWDNHVWDKKLKEEAEQIRIDKETRVQPNDSSQEVRWKIHRMLQRVFI